MNRRYLALGALVVVAAVVVAVVMLTSGQSQQPVPATSLAVTPHASPEASAAHTASPSAHTPSAAHAKFSAHAARASAPAGAKTLRGRMFETSYPSSWSVRTSTRGGTTRYQLSSTGRSIGKSGIGPAGTVGVTIDESGPSRRIAATRVAPVRLISVIVGTPAHAKGVTLTSPPRAISLDGVPAAEESFAYVLDGRANVQSDVIAKVGARVVFIELDAEPAAAIENEAGFEALTGHWRWR